MIVGITNNTLAATKSTQSQKAKPIITKQVFFENLTILLSQFHNDKIILKMFSVFFCL